MTPDAWVEQQMALAPPITQEQRAKLIGLVRRNSEFLHSPAPVPEPGPVATRTACYWHYDENDVLLYVGISANPIARARHHSARSTWVQWAVRQEARWFDTREQAKAAESHAIERDRPLFNVAENVSPDLRERQVAYLVNRGALHLLRLDAR